MAPSAAGAAAAPIPVSLGEKGSFISSSGVGLESFPLSLSPRKECHLDASSENEKRTMREEREAEEFTSQGVAG